MTEFLKEGDIIYIKKGVKVCADIPKHFIYANKRGCFDLTHDVIVLDGQFDYLIGKYIVYKTVDGGGGGVRDSTPSGYHVYCFKADDEKIKIDFYQSGPFNTKIENIKPIGKAVLTWKELERA